MWMIAFGLTVRLNSVLRAMEVNEPPVDVADGRQDSDSDRSRRYASDVNHIQRQSVSHLPNACTHNQARW